ncbi:MAG: sel1 repeat family protein [Lentisphaeria bacterium]|nr:sel1 repeat family protein [Lentisphaeria bacterium]
MERIEIQRVRLFFILLSVIFSALIPLKMTAEDDLRKKAESGDGAAQYQLGREYFSGTSARKVNREIAAYWFRKSAAAGEGAGHSAWGFCLEHGIGTAKDPVAAFYEYRKAAEKALQKRRAVMRQCC